MKEWVIKLKQLLEQRGITNRDFAKKSGLSESYVSRMLAGDYQDIKEKILEQYARGLSMTVSELRQELFGKSPLLPKERPEDILERFRITMPATVPIYPEYPFHAGTPVEPADFIAIVRNRVRGKMLEAYIVRGQCLEPEVKEGDIIVVDREGQIDNGDIVACLLDDMLHLARLRKIAGELFLENNNGRMKLDEVQMAAPVIEVRRRLK